MTISVENPDGTPVPGLAQTFDAASFTSANEDVHHLFYGSYRQDGTETDDPSYLDGVSLDAVIRLMHLDPADVGDVAFTCSSHSTRAKALSARWQDLADPTADGYPFQGEPPSPPVFSPVAAAFGGGFYFAVNRRRVDGAYGAGDLTVTNGDYCEVRDAQPMTMTLKLSRFPLFPSVHTTTPSVAVHQSVTFTADVDDADATDTHTWTWDFGDGTVKTSDEPQYTHTYTAAGNPWHVTVKVDGSNGSSGVSDPLDVVVTGPTSPPASTTPPPGPSHGNGGSTAPNNGPVNGSGPRVGGVPTNRPGTGQAGPTFASQPPVASVTAAATGSAPRIDGQIVGYLLGDAAAIVAQQNPQAATQARDDSAPAARDGSPSSNLLGWLAASVAVAALLLLGVGSERRRPSRRPRRRS